MKYLKMKDQVSGNENAGPQETWLETGGLAGSRKRLHNAISG